MRHLVFRYTRSRDPDVIDVRAACGIDGQREIGGGVFTAKDGSTFSASLVSTTCAACAEAEAK